MESLLADVQHDGQPSAERASHPRADPKPQRSARLRAVSSTAPDKEHEIKFSVGAIHSRRVIQWLRCRCQPDPEYPSALVSSIYYDTKQWRLLREKANSDYLKTKVRLRWYADIDTGEPFGAAFLEIKNKAGAHRSKLRVETNLAAKLVSGLTLSDARLRQLLELLHTHDLSLPGPLFPAFLITYKRLRFIEPATGSRVAFDHQIAAPRVNWQMLPRSNPATLNRSVFEIKGRQTQLPASLSYLISLGCRKESFSKYYLCYQKIMRTAF